MHIHILGIAGSMTAPLALALKNKDIVTGSDQDKIYPPLAPSLKTLLFPSIKPKSIPVLTRPLLAHLIKPSIALVKNLSESSKKNSLHFCHQIYR